jgi:hypothetical protein
MRAESTPSGLQSAGGEISAAPTSPAHLSDDSAPRRCTKCHTWKPLSRFAIDRRRKHGRRPICSRCRTTYDRLRRSAKKADDRLWLKQSEWEYNYRRRCSKYGIEPKLACFSPAELVARWGNQCVDCGAPWDHLDHRVPVAAGGAHDLENCRPVCAACNRSKFRTDRALIASAKKLRSRVAR